MDFLGVKATMVSVGKELALDHCNRPGALKEMTKLPQGQRKGLLYLLKTGKQMKRRQQCPEVSGESV